MAEMLAEDLQRLAVEISVNLKYHLQKGMVIEATPALETLLTNSDVDLSLPMSMVAPPYPAQYLRFGETAMRYLKEPIAQTADHAFDRVFCFLTPCAEPCAAGEPCWTLELIFASKRQDRNKRGQVKAALVNTIHADCFRENVKHLGLDGGGSRSRTIRGGVV